MRNETSHLLTTLHDLDLDLADIMLGLLTDELPADEQRRFGQLFVATGKLLEQHAELTQDDPPVDARETAERGGNADPPKGQTIV